MQKNSTKENAVPRHDHVSNVTEKPTADKFKEFEATSKRHRLLLATALESKLSHWKKLSVVKLSEAVWLLGMRSRHSDGISVTVVEGFDQDLVEIAESAAVAGELPSVIQEGERYVKPADFFTWAQSRGIPVHPDLLVKNAATKTGTTPAKIGPKPQSDWLTVTQAAVKASVTSGAISHACKKNRLNCAGTGKDRRICPKSLAAFMRTRRDNDPYEIG